jgi:hypothetical protein
MTKISIFSTPRLSRISPLFTMTLSKAFIFCEVKNGLISFLWPVPIIQIRDWKNFSQLSLENFV